MRRGKFGYGGKRKGSRKKEKKRGEGMKEDVMKKSGRKSNVRDIEIEKAWVYFRRRNGF